MLNSDSRARSVVGRIASDFGVASRLPFKAPPTTRIRPYRFFFAAPALDLPAGLAPAFAGFAAFAALPAFPVLSALRAAPFAGFGLEAGVSFFMVGRAPGAIHT